MKAFIIEFNIGGIISDGKKVLFNNSNAVAPELVPKSLHKYNQSSLEALEWQLKNPTCIYEEQREPIAELRDAIKELKSEGYEFEEKGNYHGLLV